MNNETKMRIPKKYHDALELITKDVDGVWAYTNPGYRFSTTECHTASADSQKDLMRDIQSIEPCDCEACKKHIEQEPEEVTTSPVISDQNNPQPGEILVIMHVDYTEYSSQPIPRYRVKDIMIVEDIHPAGAVSAKNTRTGEGDILLFSNEYSVVTVPGSAKAGDRIKITNPRHADGDRYKWGDLLNVFDSAPAGGGDVVCKYLNSFIVPARHYRLIANTKNGGLEYAQRVYGSTTSGSDGISES